MLGPVIPFHSLHHLSSGLSAYRGNSTFLFWTLRLLRLGGLA